MAAVMYDSAWPTSAEAFRLCRMLNNDYADALPPRLWAWGIETDNEKGVFEADPKQLARLVRFDGDCDALLAAFIACEVIESTGKPHEYRIRGWRRNARLFKERKRLRRIRENAKRTRTGTQTKPVREHVQNGLSSSSSSSFPVPKGTGGDPQPPPIETTRDAAALTVTTEQARELYQHWQVQREIVREIPIVLMPSAAMIEQAKPVLVNAGGDMELAKRAVRSLVLGKDEFWESKKWALWILGRPRDFQQALDEATAAKPKPKGKNTAAELRAIREEAIEAAKKREENGEVVEFPQIAEDVDAPA